MNDRPNIGKTVVLSDGPKTLGPEAGIIGNLLERYLTVEALMRFSKLRPPDKADVLLRLGPEATSILLSILPPTDLGGIVEELDPDQAVDVAQSLGTDQLSQVLDETNPDVAADILRGLPGGSAERILGRMARARRVTPLLEYRDDDAGGLMTPDFIALRKNMTVAQATEFVRRWAEDLDPDDVSYLFAVDRNGVLKGGISLARLVLARPHQRVSLLMHTDPISVPAETDKEYCARLMERYNLRTLPVTNESGTLVGVLKLEDMIGVLEAEATEDMYKMVGIGEEKALGSFWLSVRGRLPWLSVNLGTAFMASMVIMLFESTMSQAVVLAAFLPVIAGQGGIAGVQSLTIIVRSLALGEITAASARHLLTKEIGLGLVHGVALGALVGVITMAWKGSEWLALVVAVAMVFNMIVAGASGVLVPLTLRWLRIDPALASAVAVTTVTDVVGFLVYLGFASLLIGLITGSL